LARFDDTAILLTSLGPLETPNYRILLVEDYEPLRLSYARTFKEAGYDVIDAGTLADARALIADGRDLHAALLDYRLPDGTATSLVQELLDRRPLCRSAVVTGAIDDETAMESARCGAHAYVHKPETFPNLIATLASTIASTLEWRRTLAQEAPSGETPGTPNLPVPVGMDTKRAMARLAHIAGLSHFETLVAWRLLWGDSNKRIAQLLGCTDRTSKYHVAAVLARTGAKNRNALLKVLLVDAGIEDPWAGKGDPDTADETE